MGFREEDQAAADLLVHLDRLLPRNDLRIVEPRHAQHIFGEMGEAYRLLPDDPEVFLPFFFRKALLLEQLRESGNRRDGGLELMGHVAREVLSHIVHPVKLGGHLVEVFGEVLQFLYREIRLLRFDPDGEIPLRNFRDRLRDLSDRACDLFGTAQQHGGTGGHGDPADEARRRGRRGLGHGAAPIPEFADSQHRGTGAHAGGAEFRDGGPREECLQGDVVFSGDPAVQRPDRIRQMIHCHLVSLLSSIFLYSPVRGP